LSFAGWRRVDYLEDKIITVWSKEGAPPAVPMNLALIPPRWQGLMWGTLPFGSSLLALLVVLIPEEKWRSRRTVEPVAAEEELAPGRLMS
jgi:hypothetical protein